MTAAPGDIGFVDATDEPLHRLNFINDVGGTSQLPPGRYKIRLQRSFDDYETGLRMVGDLIDETQIDIAQVAGTTGFPPATVPYRPTEVYFGDRQWQPQPPSIIGRERALMESVAKQIHGAAKRRHNYTELAETPRGYTFEVQVEVDGEPTGHVARISIELDRLETVEP